MLQYCLCKVLIPMVFSKVRPVLQGVSIIWNFKDMKFSLVMCLKYVSVETVLLMAAVNFGAKATYYHTCCVVHVWCL